MKKNRRIFYFGGPGDIIGTYRYWEMGKRDPREVSMTFSGQFYDVCKKLDVTAYAISSRPQKDSLKNKWIEIKSISMPFKNSKNSFLYYTGQFFYGIIIIFYTLKFKASVALINNEFLFMFMLSPLTWLGVKVIPEIHNRLWHDKNRLNLAKKILCFLNINFFRKKTFAVLCVSEVISSQVWQGDGRIKKKIKVFLPTYRREDFVVAEKFNPAVRPFRILFAGRLEENKGVLDLFNIAKLIKGQGIEDIVFDICGGGPCFNFLKNSAKEENLENIFICHGQLPLGGMREKMVCAHVFIAPTRSGFLEGFNRTVAESILFERPVIASSSCPAVEKARDAVVEVSADDLEGLKQAILRLYNDTIFYEEKRRACIKYQKQFYDPANSEAGLLEEALTESFL